MNAEAVVFSTGYHNRFGFPKKAIKQRYIEAGTELYNTASDGAIIIDAKDSEATISAYRLLSPRYWHK